MTLKLRVYEERLGLKEGVSPVDVTGLKPDTTYNFECTFYDDELDMESERVPVPEFTTLPEQVQLPFALEATPTAVKVEVGKTATVKLKVSPEDATDKTVVYGAYGEANFKIVNNNNESLTIQALAPTDTPQDIHLMMKANPAATADITVEVVAATEPEA